MAGSVATRFWMILWIHPWLLLGILFCQIALASVGTYFYSSSEWLKPASMLKFGKHARKRKASLLPAQDSSTTNRFAAAGLAFRTRVWYKK